MGLSWSRLFDTVASMAVEKSSLLDHSSELKMVCHKEQQVGCVGPERDGF